MANIPSSTEELELNLLRYELRSGAGAIKLENVPMQLLILLARNPGRLVTREEIVERLWGKDVFVDTRQGINTAILKIRLALKDSAEQPRFIETVVGRGYRFIGPVRLIENGARSELRAFDSPRPLEPRDAAIPATSEHFTSQQRFGWRLRSGGAAFLLLVVATLGYLSTQWFKGSSRHPATSAPIHSVGVLPIENLSGDASQEYFADGITDELITNLATIRSLRVISRTSVMQYKNVRKPLPEIARALN